ncbi:aspartate/glutamate racemase family protein [Siccirubricoccus phaeus]|uniref:aspartate/glutamate racemase family protein n=1 Tax=Siccirubricoccus phaeus TaxID=2595053 RepID=UPI0011F13E44|nr:aspartate/glutamate racemase family protein [Siccirubricoccus phaeus]
MTRLLILNGNTTEAVTERIAAAARAAAPPGVEIIPATAPYGLPLIVTRADWLLSGPPILEALAARRGEYDAAVIAVFGDPALKAAKELLDVPVLGISEAAFHAACMLGTRFGIVSFTTALQPMFEDCLDQHGLRARCAGFRMGPPEAGYPAGFGVAERATLLALIRASVEQDGAEAVILAGGPLAGLAAVLQPEVKVPLVDGTVAAVRLAAALAGMAPAAKSRRARPISGFGPGIAALYAG